MGSAIDPWVCVCMGHEGKVCRETSEEGYVVTMKEGGAKLTFSGQGPGT